MASESIGTALVFICLIISLLIITGAVTYYITETSESTSSQINNYQDMKKTSFNITKAEYDNGTNTLNISITNTGEKSVYADEIVILIDGTAQDPTETFVESNNSYSLILPREQASFIFDQQGDYVKIIAPNGYTESKTILQN